MLTKDRLAMLRAELDCIQEWIRKEPKASKLIEREAEILKVLREEGYAMRSDWFRPKVYR